MTNGDETHADPEFARVMEEYNEILRLIGGGGNEVGFTGRSADLVASMARLSFLECHASTTAPGSAGRR